MANIKLIIEYNGSRFHGWQKQPGLRTVQEELHKALELVLRTKIKEVIASGRTDAGVHAKAQVVNFHVDTLPDLDRLRKSVSSILKSELSVLSAEEVPQDFHSRFSANSKTYCYTILNRDVPTVLDWGRVWLVSADLDLELMSKQANLLCGEHDFKSFQASGCVAKTTIKTIYSSELISNPPYLIYRVKGSGFLKQMVRNIVGTLVSLGKDNFSLPGMLELIQASDRTLAGPTAPAYGLCLEEVGYGSS